MTRAKSSNCSRMAIPTVHTGDSSGDPGQAPTPEGLLLSACQIPVVQAHRGKEERASAAEIRPAPSTPGECFPQPAGPARGADTHRESREFCGNGDSHSESASLSLIGLLGVRVNGESCGLLSGGAARPRSFLGPREIYNI